MERGAVLSGVAHNTRSWELFFFFSQFFFLSGHHGVYIYSPFTLDNEGCRISSNKWMVVRTNDIVAS